MRRYERYGQGLWMKHDQKCMGPGHRTPRRYCHVAGGTRRAGVSTASLDAASGSRGWFEVDFAMQAARDKDMWRTPRLGKAGRGVGRSKHGRNYPYYVGATATGSWESSWYLTGLALLALLASDDKRRD